jgi:Cu(I)/Ag(I) efflux system periplasmic protein CusF
MNTQTTSSRPKLALLAIVGALSALLAACGRNEPSAPVAQQTAPAEDSMDGMSTPESTVGQPASSDANSAEGTIQKIDQQARTVTIAHGPVASLSWPAMTMAFQVQDEGMFATLKEGDQVEFSFTSGLENQYVITAISPRR